MNQQPHTDRRDFLKFAGAGTATALSALTIPRVFGSAGVNHNIQIALVGCGGRGTGAVGDALTAASYPTKLVAMADVFRHRLDESIGALEQQYKDKPELVNVPEDKRFSGFDGYKKAMDCLRPGDIVIMATPLAFRWLHFQYAIDKGLNVFMEKPLVADSITAKKMLDLSKKADDKNLKVSVGLMIRHCRARQELYKRITDGAIGDIVAMRAYRMHGPVGSCFSTRKPEDRDELPWQIERFHSFIWASGGLFNDFYVHQIDEVCWMKNKWPISALGLGGRNFRKDFVDQNFDTYSIEYTFDDGSKFYYDGRTMVGTPSKFASVVHGTKGSGIVSTSGHHPGKCRIFNNQLQEKASTVWAFPQPEKSPYTLEWQDLFEAVIQNKPHNEVPRAIQACLVCNMGRMAAHTGEEITYDQIVACPHEMAPGLADFTMKGPAPVMPDKHGKYPVPTPGVTTDREYGKKA